MLRGRTGYRRSLIELDTLMLHQYRLEAARRVWGCARLPHNGAFYHTNTEHLHGHLLNTYNEVGRHQRPWGCTDWKLEAVPEACISFEAVGKAHPPCYIIPMRSKLKTTHHHFKDAWSAWNEDQTTVKQTLDPILRRKSENLHKHLLNLKGSNFIALLASKSNQK